MILKIKTVLLSSTLLALTICTYKINAQNIAPQATIIDAGLNYASYAGFQSNQSFITDGNKDTTLQMDYQVAFDNANTKLLTFYLDQEYTNIQVKFYNSSIHNTGGINGATFYLYNTVTAAVSPTQTLNESNEIAGHIIELNFITDNFTSGYNTVVFQFTNNNISFREIEIYGTPITPPDGGNPNPPSSHLWLAAQSSNTIYHESGLVRIGNTNTLPSISEGSNSYFSPRGLLVNGHTTFNVGRGNVFLENNINDDSSGAGLTLRTTQNPAENAPIFSVRSAGDTGRLWVGQKSSNFGSNNFYFGGNEISEESNTIDNFKGVLTKNARMGIGTITPDRALHIRGGADGFIQIDRNQNGAGILFANYNTDWSAVNSSGIMGLKEDGSFEIVNLNGALGGSSQEPSLKIEALTHDVHIVNSLTVGVDAEKINNTIAHFDGRVYISEADAMVEVGNLESRTEKGFSDQTLELYKDYLLWVEKGIVTNDFAVADTADWPDYVFDEEYKLTSIEKLKTFLKQNGHLPTMPSAKEIGKNGFTVSDMTKRMLQTIEEMTLHVVEHDNNLNQMQDEAEVRIKRLKALLENPKK